MLDVLNYAADLLLAVLLFGCAVAWTLLGGVFVVMVGLALLEMARILKGD